jgi:cell division septation protein DedD
MTCRNCGYQNQPDDAFCGSCGEFLRYANEPADEPADDPTEATEQRQEVPRQYAARRSTGEPPRMARRAAPGVVSGVVTCWNCGRRNPTSRVFCQQCGERLSVGSLAYSDMARPQSNWVKALAAGLALIAVVLVAALGAMFLFGGDALAPSPTPTGGAVVTASPSPIATPMITAAPTLPPTAEPTLTPTEQPTEPASPPPPTPANCTASSFPTAWVNLSGADTSARVRREQIWCIHQVIVVPDPNFGEGIIRLQIGNSTLVEVAHSAGSTSTEYPYSYSPAQMVPSRTDVSYAMSCASGNFCNAVIQVGYELIETP